MSMRQTDRTSYTVAAWLPAEGCYGGQLVSGGRETAEAHRQLLIGAGHEPGMIDMWETTVRVLRGSGT